MHFENSLLQQQKQVITTKQIQSLDILACTNQEIDRLLRDEFLTNPILEYGVHKDSSEGHRESTYGSYRSHGSKSDEGVMRDIPCQDKRTIKEDLKDQLDGKKYNKRQYQLMMILIDYLEEDGFFPYQIEELAKELGRDVAELSYCLSELKQLEPVGIFSRNIEECLMAQLLQQGVTDPILYQLLQQYTKDILKGNISFISKEMGLSTAKLKEYIKIITTLNPKPILPVYDEEVEYIMPDLIVTRSEDQWEVAINDGWIGDYSYNNYYIKLMKEASDENLVEYFKENYDRAKFIITCVEQRRSTLIKIIEAVLERQNDYFLNNGKLKPMSLSDLSYDIGVHVSTISRAIKGKYLQYKKVMLVRDLFQGGVGETEGSQVTSEQVKDIIRSMIEQEDKPLSDNQIGVLLLEQGIQISRRTVAKYRLEMNILDSSQRKLLK